MADLTERAPPRARTKVEVKDVAGEAAADWLDACCWRCGAADALPDRDGRLLCVPCRGALFDPPGSSTDPIRLSEGAYWESHALERCWRCMSEAVDPDDEVGLCRRCLGDLDRSRPGAPGDG